MTIFMLVMLFSLVIAGLWNSFPLIKNSVHFILDPTVGFLLNYNYYVGMFIIVGIISFITMLVQKYGTDQETLKKMREEQKFMREEMKKYKDNPEKILELNKKQLEDMPKLFEITMKPLIYTFVPFVLFFRWFNDYFSATGFKFFGFFFFIWFYIILSIIFSSIWKKILKVA